MAFHFASLSIEFIESSGRSYPEVSMSILPGRSDGVVAERERVGGIMNIILQRAAVRIQPEQALEG